MKSNMIEKVAHGSVEIASAILEMAEVGYYPIEYRLPIIIFSDNGERAELTPSMEILVEDTMLKMQDKEIKNIKTSISGLISFFKKEKSIPTGKDVIISIDSLNRVEEIIIAKVPDITDLSFPSLKELARILEKENVFHNKNYKLLKFTVMAKIKKLKKTF